MDLCHSDKRKIVSLCSLVSCLLLWITCPYFPVNPFLYQIVDLSCQFWRSFLCAREIYPLWYKMQILFPVSCLIFHCSHGGFKNKVFLCIWIDHFTLMVSGFCVKQQRIAHAGIAPFQYDLRNVLWFFLMEMIAAVVVKVSVGMFYI